MPPRNEIPEFKQFCPLKGATKEKGDFGWGFEKEGFRFFMYGPPSADSPEVVQYRRERSKEKHGGTWKKDTPGFLKNKEHGPAHIHIVHTRKNSESRFKLVVGEEGTQLTLFSERDSEKPNPLSEEDTRRALVIANRAADSFVELWKKLNRDNPKVAHHIEGLPAPTHLDTAPPSGTGMALGIGTGTDD